VEGVAPSSPGIGLFAEGADEPDQPDAGDSCGAGDSMDASDWRGFLDRLVRVSRHDGRPLPPAMHSGLGRALERYTLIQSPIRDFEKGRR
jgi:hypothetical protein